MQGHEDTIAAIATPVGQGAIGIVRLSGPEALEIAGRIFLPKRSVPATQSHRLYLGYIKNPQTGALIDKVLLSFMKAPHSYTGEDVVEINSHSGPVLLQTILEILLRQGARLAAPGEFTFRAFMNGKIDLTQAEAVIDLITAKTEDGLSLAFSQLTGNLGDKIRSLRGSALKVLAALEAAIDFPEEEDTLFASETLAEAIRGEILTPLKDLINEGNHGRIIHSGVKIAIVGKSNAGKSSLFNRLLDTERAIVTATPGTTRDMIESEMILEGIPVRLMDTAGIREPGDEVERIGIAMTEKALQAADLLVLVADRSSVVSEDDRLIARMCKGKYPIIALNKSDLIPVLSPDDLRREVGECDSVAVSALTGMGMTELKMALLRRVKGKENGISKARLTLNLRQTRALSEALSSFEKAEETLSSKMPAEIAALEIKTGIDFFDSLTGQNAGEDLLDEIFSRFCIGK